MKSDPSRQNPNLKDPQDQQVSIRDSIARDRKVQLLALNNFAQVRCKEEERTDRNICVILSKLQKKIYIEKKSLTSRKSAAQIGRKALSRLCVNTKKLKSMPGG